RGNFTPVMQTNKPAFQTVEDRDGNKVGIFVDSANRKAWDLNGNPINLNGAAGAPSTLPGAGASGLTGTAYLDQMRKSDPGRAGVVESLIEGRLSPPQLGRYGTAKVASLLRDAAIVDPTFDATNFQGHQTAVKSFMGGKDADTVRALNQAILHAGSLIK